MSADRDITDVVLAGFVSVLRQEHVRHPDEVARKQIAIAKAHGVRFAVPVHWHDPRADPLKPQEPGDQQAGVAAALAALGKGICPACGARVDLAEDGRIAPHEISDDPPHPPFHPCPGAQVPDEPDATDQSTPDPTDQEPTRD